MKRIVVIGNNGSGKSIFSARLGEKTKNPVIHLDTHFHLPGWKKRPSEEFYALVDNFIKKDRWIIDGLYRKTLIKRIEAADTIIFLDIPKYKTFYRIFKRRIIYRKGKRPDMPDFLNEQISFTLIRKNILFNKKEIYKILDNYSGKKKIIILKNNKEIENFLTNI